RRALVDGDRACNRRARQYLVSGRHAGAGRARDPRILQARHRLGADPRLRSVQRHGRVWPRTHSADQGRLARHRSPASGRLNYAEIASGGESAAASCSTMSALFSPIITAATLVLPETTVGMIEASITRRPSKPRTRTRSSTTADGSGPMRQVEVG